MRHTGRVFGLLIAIVLVGGTVAPRGQGRSMVVVATLSGAHEVPPTQTGSVGKIACTVTDTEISCRVDSWNAETARSGAHIHVSPAGINGPIVCDAQVARVAGDLGYSFTCNQANLRPARAQGIDTFANFVHAVASCGAYFNEHTELRPGGNIRGQLVPKGRNPFTGINDCVGLTND